ncbi:hypothetical protein BZA05DRAFT_383346 [Tricharina praecox]|uniref:uncharacterized protein n=1 Tax=Tricharina praecox TaxID=43433 RepID=UPI00222057D7|nr:uncharacterized protein BZA05DRAFT_383346 [Tricharina praecox]KAI5859105.1 hypothetical protein BZA05DRAFT_383346 [Tricharina praecox]
MVFFISSIYSYLASFFSASPAPTAAAPTASSTNNSKHTSRPALDGPSLSTLPPYPPTREEALYPPCPLDGETAMSASVEQLVKEAKMVVPKDA